MSPSLLIVRQNSEGWHLRIGRCEWQGGCAAGPAGLPLRPAFEERAGERAFGLSDARRLV